MPQQWEQGHGLEDNHHEVRSLKITVSMAEYMEQRLVKQQVDFSPLSNSKVSHEKHDSALTALMFQSLFSLHIPRF